MSTCTSTYVPSEPHTSARRPRTTPERCYRVAGRYALICAAVAGLLCGLGLYIALAVAPGVINQGYHNLIVFIHIPSGWMSILLYLATAAAAIMGRVGRHRLASMCASALAPTGALFAFLSLWTGSLWMKPNWGLWWIWEPRQTSQLLLLLLFLGYIALQGAIDNPRRADRIGAVLINSGMFAVPTVFFVMHWWSVRQGTLELGLMIERSSGATMVWGLLAMTFGLLAYSAAAALTRLRIVILERERDSEWVAARFGIRR